ncbi:L-carnitine dehydratase/bile acid-inducible protein F [Acidovorax delafieldii 2AN]|uniref:L-carnitine dehydratase/bile acid-inducible protein F n=1 Tax=Acidovorax delafieldii 2AN TaxID=573060 RepID=C5T099_ACIDE|nr:CaiB/BaiF CoA-transferase family protein [Acidovorax delafieldii]EER62052.1 L-carnitine dehydratase/bile acid-inducible protein F [Acidovorax delafieldii 2AN]
MTHKASGLKPLTGVRVLDMSRLAPGPYCTLLLADLGAEVIVIGGGRAGLPVSSFSRGKHFIALDLKSEAGRAALQRLVRTADVFVEGFRPGVAGRLGAGYESLSKINPGLIYCSLTGYGQSGPLAQEAGHDLNYLALTGLLGSIGPVNGPPTVPLNLIADFAGGSLVATIGILAALYERVRSGRGQHIDAAMVDGCLSLMAMHSSVWGSATAPARGRGWLSGAAPYYRCYACKDGLYVSVGALEPQFFAVLWADLVGGAPPDQMDMAEWPRIEAVFCNAFMQRTRDEWAAHFAGRDVCVFPVLSSYEAWQHPHILERHPEASADQMPAVPRFSRTPLTIAPTDTTDRSTQVLAAAGLSPEEIERASPRSERERGHDSRHAWPPPLYESPKTVPMPSHGASSTSGEITI